MILPGFLRNVRLQTQMNGMGRKEWHNFLEQANRPQAVQESVLKRILHLQANTTFGKTYRFKSIRGYLEYRLGIPIHTYEDLAPFIREQEKNKEPRINHEQPLGYTMASGTSGTSKLIPVLSDTRYALSRHQLLGAYARFQAMPSMFHGRLLVIAGAEVEGYLETGTGYGSMSGLWTSALPAALKSKLFLPDDLQTVGDYEKKYFYLAAAALAEPDISTIMAADPFIVVKLVGMVRQHFAQLLDLLSAQGQDEHLEGLCLPAVSPQRLRYLQGFLGHEDNLTVEALWPDLQSVVTWTGGSCGLLIPRLKALLPSQTAVIELGYLASECAVSVNVDPRTNQCVPTISDHFFEFVKQADWEQRRPHAYTLEQLEEGQHYYVLVTTSNGLYRYFLNDLIEVTGRFYQTPTIRFVQQGSGRTNLTEEHLYEYQVREAMEGIQQAYHTTFDFYVMVGDVHNRQYTLYLEHAALDFFVAYKVEERLSQANPGYQAMRDSGKLNPLHVVYVQPGTADAYKAFWVQRGRRDSQFTFVVLQYADKEGFEFSKYARE
jgi:hypothetical protein